MDKDAAQSGHRTNRLRRIWAGLHLTLRRTHPAKLLLLGYLLYTAFGWFLLSLPLAHEVPVSVLDALFIASSAVSTTGLVTVDPGSSFSWFGEGVIILLIQVGGLGYMTIGSFALLAFQDRLSRVRSRTIKAEFSLPEDFSVRGFLSAVVIFTFVVQSVGAIILYLAFLAEGVDNPLWSAIFHAISAFCTAGFSLNSSSFEMMQANTTVVLTLSALSILGAVGFLIVVDAWRNLTGGARHLGFTSKVILRVTFWLLAGGTVLFYVADASIAELSPWDRLLAAFFQVMTATTTVGFNTWPIGEISMAGLVVLMGLMVIGASPAGTGGGLKTTTLAALFGLVRSTLKGRDEVRLAKRRVPAERLQSATAALAYYVALLFVALFLLGLTEAGADFEVLMFEAISAMGTVGLSMGITGDLSPLGKLVVIVLMIAGRVGILTFGIAVAAHDETREEEADNNLIC
ncbi:TrkH family potassium uptake protein [Rhodophyticola porphyridii]|uniref:Potassium transporter KtrB n=1 Tax=Rhodophyticola porphyridii TaxID=1852017 RepID=A0A3L9YAD7_9RHOB|nr:potassium transporter TrkG [Rhodophyticola porphyridii]RMA43223.1 potassium transporter KtrB [Rhodophyticola porphyridii]